MILILSLGWYLRRRVFFPFIAKVFLWSSLLSICGAGILLGVGKMVSSEIELKREGNQIRVNSCGLEGEPGSRILLLPDRATLGESWGKEVRRMLADELFRNCELTVCASGAKVPEQQVFDRIIVCGSRQEEGLAIAAQKSSSKLLIVHPIGRPYTVKPI